MSVYKTLADVYINSLNYYLSTNDNSYIYNNIFKPSKDEKSYGFLHKKEYLGRMAKVDSQYNFQKKQGCLDLYIYTDERYLFYDNQRAVSHYKLFHNLFNNSNLDNCKKVWQGEDPRDMNVSLEEKKDLVTLLLLFFEQEINWGGNCWQRFSNFSPDENSPKKRRPRDMIMGYIKQLFDENIGLDNLKYWQQDNPKRTVYFRNEDTNVYNFSSYPAEYKKYFTELENDDAAEALMVGDYLEKFKNLVEKFSNHPLYVDKAIK